MSKASVTFKDSKAVADIRIEAYDTSTLAVECMNYLGGLFDAIKTASDEHSQPYRLASLGGYLADDFMNTFDLESSKYTKPKTGESS